MPLKDFVCSEHCREQYPDPLFLLEIYSLLSLTDAQSEYDKAIREFPVYRFPVVTASPLQPLIRVIRASLNFFHIRASPVTVNQHQIKTQIHFSAVLRLR